MLRRIRERALAGIGSPDCIIAELALGVSLILLIFGLVRLSPVALLLAALFGIPGAIWFFSKGKAPFHLDLTFTDDMFFFVSGSFFLVLAVTIVLFVLRTMPYTRPAAFFLLLPLLVGLTAVAALGASRPAHECLCLIQVIVISLLCAWTQIVMAPDVIGVDPWYHKALTEDLIRTQMLPTNPTFAEYVYFPIFHLTIAAMSLMAGLPYHLSGMLSVSLLIILVNCLFVYLLACELVPRFRALRLLAPLFVAITSSYLIMTISLIPNGFAIIFILPVLLILYRSAGNLSRPMALLVAIFLVTLIITHTVSAFFTAMVLFLSWGAFELHSRLVKRENSFPLLLPILFTMVMLAWWRISGNAIRIVLDMFAQGLTTSYFRPEYTVAFAEFKPIPYWDNFLLSATYYVFLFFPLLGMLYMLSPRGTRFTYNLAILGTLPLLIISVSLVLPITVMEDRWNYFSTLMNGVAMAISLLILLGSLVSKTGYTRYVPLAVVILLFSSLTVLTEINPNASTDYKPVSPHASPRPLTVSELVVLPTAFEVWNGMVWTDYYLTTQRLVYPRTKDYTAQVYDRNFSAMNNDIVLVRAAVIENPVYLHSYVYIPYYDLDGTLMAQRYSRVLDVGSARGYRVMAR